MLPPVVVTENGKEYPYAGRDELLGQILALKKQYSNSVSYSIATLDEMLGTELLTSATQSTADELRTGILWNERGRLIFKPLPVEAQYAPIYAIEAIDVDKDGKKDLILGGNLGRTRVRMGKMDANKGQVFLNDGKQLFRPVSQSKSGISLAGEVRSIGTAGPYLLFVINRLPVQLYRLP